MKDVIQFEKAFEAQSLSREDVQAFSEWWEHARLDIPPEYRERIDDRLAQVSMNLDRAEMSLDLFADVPDEMLDENALFCED